MYKKWLGYAICVLIGVVAAPELRKLPGLNKLPSI
jgi:hypothetical protein